MTVYRHYEPDGGAWDEMVNDGEDVTRERETNEIIPRPSPLPPNEAIIDKIMRQCPRSS